MELGTDMMFSVRLLENKIETTSYNKNFIPDTHPITVRLQLNIDSCEELIKAIKGGEYEIDKLEFGLFYLKSQLGWLNIQKEISQDKIREIKQIIKRYGKN